MKTDREKLRKIVETWLAEPVPMLEKFNFGAELTDYLISKGVTIPVRCGECIYMEEAYEKNGFLMCPASGMEIMNTDFCSYGERKEE